MCIFFDTVYPIKIIRNNLLNKKENSHFLLLYSKFSITILDPLWQNYRIISQT